MRWKKITVVGVGLLGGSLGLALRQRQLTNSVVGVVRHESDAAEAEQAGAVDYSTCDLRLAVQDAEIVVLCTPISQMHSLLEKMLPALRPGMIVTDVGSVKARLVTNCEPLVAKTGAHFVGSHPMAGGESSGVRSARADLFKNAICAVTSTASSHPNAVLEVEELWRSVGGRPLQLSPEMHDALVSRSSHLPHIIAAMLAKRVLDPANPKHQALLCAGGFRDTTRIASGSPEMWCDISMANRQNLSSAIDTFVADLVKFNGALKAGKHQVVSRMLRQSKQRRDRWAARMAAGGSVERKAAD